MRRILVLLLLLSHMNASMFLPQVPMEDVYDENGFRLDDITSVAELIMVNLGFDDYPDDEDADAGQYFFTSHYEYVFNIVSTKADNSTSSSDGHLFFDINEEVISGMAFDVPVPPPDSV